MKRKCEHCGKSKDVSQFWKREDRKTFWAWCIKCCIEEGREEFFDCCGGGSLNGKS